MKYFNTYELIKEVITGKIDYEKHLKSVSQEEILKNLKRKRENIPLSKEFFITDEPQEEENFAKLPENIKDDINKIGYDIKHADKDTKEKHLKNLLKLQKTYPNVPVIYNYLTVIYAYLGDKEKQYKAIMETKDKFPDYLFGKISLADYYLQNKLSNKILSAFDNKLEIYTCIPQKSNLYHISEVRAFYSLIGQYYLSQNKIDHALLCYFLLKQIDAKHPPTILLGKMIVVTELENIYKKGDRSRH
jgi:hypothetical protein